MSQMRGLLLRVRDEDEARVTPLELFFDLVYVFAITQLSHLLLDRPTLGGALQTLFLLLVVWWAWHYTAWFTNWFDPDALPVRLVLVGVMLASLVMSAAIPEAFGERGLMFALAYVAVQAGRTAFSALALDASHPRSGDSRRILVWFAASGVLWAAGGLSDGGARQALWLTALLVDYAAPAARYRTPGLGRSRTEEWRIEGAHIAERCQLFVIVALGESILVTGATFAETEVSAATIAALAVAFVGSAALWWTYFARYARDASETIARSPDPGSMARSAYAYSHIPIVAGIIAVAAADELLLAHPGEPGTSASVSLTLGGTALFVSGHALFVWSFSGRVPWSRFVAVGALAALVPASFTMPALFLALAAALIVVLLGGWDSLGHHRGAGSPRRVAT